jgi:hypothetical protein
MQQQPSNYHGCFITTNLKPAMKTIIFYSILLPVFATIFSACHKNDDAEPPPDPRFPLPLIQKIQLVMLLFRARIHQLFSESSW